MGMINIDMSDIEYTSILSRLDYVLASLNHVVCTRDVIKKLPKADIHVHLPGTISPATAWELGVRNGLLRWKDSCWRAPRLSSNNPHTTYAEIFKDFGRFCYDPDPDLSLLEYNIEHRNFISFDQIMATVQGHRHPPGGIQTKQDLLFVLRKYLQQCLTDNIIYTEVQQNIRIAYAIYPFLSQKEARIRLYSLFAMARDLFASKGIVLRFINCFNKTNSSRVLKSTQERSQEAAVWLEEANQIFPDLFVGLQSAGAENCVESKPSLLHVGYQYAYERGFGCEAHAGEGIGFGYLYDTLNTLPLQRVAHGFQAIENQNTIDLLRDKEITLVMAPVINLALGATLHQYDAYGTQSKKIFIQKLDDHPFFTLYRHHCIKTTLSSDNPKMGGASLQDTMFLLAGLSSSSYQNVLPVFDHPLSFRELVEMTLQAIISSFLPVKIKTELLNKVLMYALEVSESNKTPSLYNVAAQLLDSYKLEKNQ